jgi:hypothetical protein
MILIRALATPFVSAAVLLCCWCCCEPAAEVLPALLDRELVYVVGGYSLGGPLGVGLQLYEPPHYPTDGTALTYDAVVEQTVVTIGWDEDFILVERHPPRVAFLHEPRSGHPEWYIVVVSTGEVHSHLSYDEFLLLREELGVADSIEMRDASDVYYGR